MDDSAPTLQQFWQELEFEPNPNQEEAILHTDGPLYLTAGPGSGKTRVILWRTLNLIVFHDIDPDDIFLSTFTEKAAHQLREGLRALLNLATRHTGEPYDISRMYVGTVHSLCQKLLTDRRFTQQRRRGRSMTLLDALAQYFQVYRRRNWEEMVAAVGWGAEAAGEINDFFEGYDSLSRHRAATNCIALFNRLSEECIDPHSAKEECEDPRLGRLFDMYAHYRNTLDGNGSVSKTDFSLLQQHGLKMLNGFDGSDSVFKHVIIDEYQDTNAIQEKLFFKLAAGHKNICVVGDDDQALYRFRGATVENFVEFPTRCKQYLDVEPRKIPLSKNYRSRKHIVSFYTRFIDQCNWAKDEPGEYYRVVDKNIHSHSEDGNTAVVASTPGHPDDVCAEVADLVKRLLDTERAKDPNQIAFLFPSLKSAQVPRMQQALEAIRLKNGRQVRVYAPRAGRFLEVDESIDMFGLFLHVFGKVKRGDFPGQDYRDYHTWIDLAYARGRALIDEDELLARYVTERREEVRQAVSDYEALKAVVEAEGWDLEAPYDLDTMKRPLCNASGLSAQAKRGLGTRFFDDIVRKRIEDGNPFTLGYVLRRATSLDWSVLDLFYRLCGFEHFKAMFDVAENGEDEGPICNLSLISQYLARYTDEYAAIITADVLRDDLFLNIFFGSYLFALFRLGESEFEDAEDPFPRGRIPFLTIHQAKGLEFPVVVLGNPRTGNQGVQTVEQIMRPFLDRESEPLDRIKLFDEMRMFYVALSRPQNLLVIPYYKSQGNYINEEFRRMIGNTFPRISELDLTTVPAADEDDEDIPKNYSYTADYLLYQQCPRQYMIFRKYGFAPSRSQTMMFGSVVHQTLEDLHQLLIARRAQAAES